jgi:serine/threonine protein phosphatase PrpC
MGSLKSTEQASKIVQSLIELKRLKTYDPDF